MGKQFSSALLGIFLLSGCFIGPVDLSKEDARKNSRNKIEFKTALMKGAWSTECKPSVYDNSYYTIERLYLNVDVANKASYFFADSACKVKLFDVVYNATIQYSGSNTTFFIQSGLITVHVDSQTVVDKFNTLGFCEPRDWIVGQTASRAAGTCGVDTLQNYEITPYQYGNQKILSMKHCKASVCKIVDFVQ